MQTVKAYKGAIQSSNHSPVQPDDKNPDVVPLGKGNIGRSIFYIIECFVRFVCLVQVCYKLAVFTIQINAVMVKKICLPILIFSSSTFDVYQVKQVHEQEKF